MRIHAPRIAAPVAVLLSVLLLSSLVPVLAADGAEKKSEEQANYKNLARSLKEGDYGLTLRYRFEGVTDDAPIFEGNDGLASTLRTTLYYRSARFHQLEAFLEFENVSDIGLADEHNNLGAGDLWNGVGDRPVILDPPLSEINQVTLGYHGVRETDFVVGRKEINLGDQRFVGAVGWRQNHQSFDAFIAQTKVLPRTKLFYAYSNNANRVNGLVTSMNSHFLNAVIGLNKAGTVEAYYYLIDFDESTLVSPATSSYGAAWHGSLAAGENWKIPFRVELAQQNDTGDNPNNVDAQYARLVVGADWKVLQFKVGYELLGGGPDEGAFRTPLATLHKFNGWADRFVITPPDGLRDLFFSVGAGKGRWKGVVIYHGFSADSGGANYGSEIDAQVLYTASWKQNFGLKFAFFSADEWSFDTNKVWLWTGYKF